jgi:mannose-6-phosphate isomerase-like protein (cupin superfamily)
MDQKNSCKKMKVADALRQLPNPEGKQFATVFEHGTLEVEIYAPRGNDPQSPHRRDELYFVVAGNGEYVCDDTRQSFGPTDLLFAAAGVSHRFENFSDDLTLWVIFYGPDGGEARLSPNEMPRP